MIHLPELIQDLGLILCAAGIFTLLFKKLRQPLVLGYILAGMLVGPHFALFPTVTDIHGIETWAEIGVIFLLFSLGLEFSFKKLASVGSSAGITAVVEVLGMLLFGYLTGRVLGWNGMDSIFLGGILSISSTTIIIRAFDELHVKTKSFAKLVFGVLIVEDLVAILLLVLLSTLAVSRQFQGKEMLSSVLKLAFFIILWFLAGIFLLPTFLRRVKKLMNEETLLVVSIALCMLMVILSTQAGFSPALGAFIMGSILAETVEAEKIEHLVKPVKDLFGAIFFVSVGMLIDPQMLVKHAVPVLVITLVTITGKFISSGIGALLAGESLKTSVRTGTSLAQIGEFSFIIATLGLTLKVTSDFLYPIAVAVSAITTFTTPYLIKNSDRLYGFLNTILPTELTNRINRYSTQAKTINAVSEWRIVLRKYAIVILLNAVIIIGILLLAVEILGPFITQKILPGTWGKVVTIGVTLALMSPFVWAMSVKRIHVRAYKNIWLNNKYNRGPLIMMEILRVALAVFFTGFLLDLFFTPGIAVVVALICSAGIYFIFSHRLQSFYGRLEKRFLHNLDEREHVQRQANALAPWDAHLTPFEIAPESIVVGKTLQELAFRERFGINIALIERGATSIYAPARTERLYPFDRLMVLGSDEQLEHFRPLLDPIPTAAPTPGNKDKVALKRMLLNTHSALVGKSIKESGIREKTRGLVVGIERNEQRLLNPESDVVFQKGDVLWIVGEEKYINDLLIQGQ